MKKKNIDVIFVCLPPSETAIPSPAFSILKSYLQSRSISSNIIYANHLFETSINSINNKSRDYNGGNEIFLPFISIMDKLFNGKKSKNIKTYYETTFPNLFLVDKSLFEELKDDLENQYFSIIAKFVNEIKESGAKIVGFTSKFHQWIPSILFAYEIKKNIPDISIISGGWTNSKSAHDFLKLNRKLFDYAIWGEGELPLELLISFILKHDNSTLDKIPRLVYQLDGRVIKNSQGDKNSYINFSQKTLKPDYVDFFESINKVGIKEFIFPIERGRGCNWNKCSFCYLSQGYNFRIKTTDVICREIIELIQEYGIFKAHAQ
jgi:radical SAM superfamily enzyme YgiQ (UPF0313 family)